MGMAVSIQMETGMETPIPMYPQHPDSNLKVEEVLQTARVSSTSGTVSPASSLNEDSLTKMSADLSHVPCKFFRQGTCQAGKACPFLHSMDGGNEQMPCKYFQKVAILSGLMIMYMLM